MSEELRMRFVGKIQGRPTASRRGPGANQGVTGMTPPGSVRLRGLEHGLRASDPALRECFDPDTPLLRLTLDLQPPEDPRASPPGDFDLEALERLAPSLGLLRCPHDAPPLSAGASDGLALVHLMAHTAAALQSAVSPATPARAAACAWVEPADRFDLLLACDDAALGRASALLAMAAVRDLLEGVDRLPLHLLSRDLLARFAGGGAARSWTPEDAAADLGVDVAPARAALESLARVGYLETLTAPFTFSSPSGVIFRRVAGPAA